MRRFAGVSVANCGAVLALLLMAACDSGYELIVHNSCETTIRVTVFDDLQQAKDAQSEPRPNGITIASDATGSFTMLGSYRRGDTYGVIVESAGIEAIFEVRSASETPRLEVPKTAC